MKVNSKGIKFMSDIQFVSSPAITPEEAGRPRFPEPPKKEVATKSGAAKGRISARVSVSQGKSATKPSKRRSTKTRSK